MNYELNMPEHKALFLGAETIFIATAKIVNGDLFILYKNNVFGKKWRIVAGNIAEKMINFEERRIHNLSKGVTEDVARIYLLDFGNYKEYVALGNKEIIRAMKSVQEENNLLFQQVQELSELLNDSIVLDAHNKKFKKQHDFINSLKPNQTINTQKVKKK